MPEHPLNQLSSLLKNLERRQRLAAQAIEAALNRPEVTDALGRPRGFDVAADLSVLSPTMHRNAAERGAAAAEKGRRELQEAWADFGGEPPNQRDLTRLATRKVNEVAAIERIGGQLQAFCLSHATGVGTTWAVPALAELKELRDKTIKELVKSDIAPIGQRLSADFAEGFQHMFSSTRLAIEAARDGRDTRIASAILLEQKVVIAQTADFFATAATVEGQNIRTAPNDLRRISQAATTARESQRLADVMNEAFTRYWASPQSAAARAEFDTEGRTLTPKSLTEKIALIAGGSEYRFSASLLRNASSQLTRNFEGGQALSAVAPKSELASLG